MSTTTNQKTDAELQLDAGRDRQGFPSSTTCQHPTHDERTAQYIREVVAAAPPLTAAQRAELRFLLGGGQG